MKEIQEDIQKMKKDAIRKINGIKEDATLTKFEKIMSTEMIQLNLTMMAIMHKTGLK